MRAAILAPIFAAAVLAQDSSSVDEFPQTSFLTQTNSLGVVTGMPSVETSQPAVAPVVTSQPALATSVGEAATIPAVGEGITTLVRQGTMGVNSTQTIVVSANNSTTVVISTVGVGGSTSSPSATGTGRNPSQSGGDDDEDPSGTATGGPQSTGAAATMRAVAGSVAGIGAFVAAFL